ncbi:MAG: ROK family transcriptional regulator [Spirochaetales bacterium]|nr:ROK family transcriptional regulator [Spirochaetales bacterium]
MNKKSAEQNGLIKQKNVSEVLQVMLHNHTVSRVDIAMQTNLTPATISNIIAKLKKANIVKFVGIGDSSGGRRPMLVEINPKSFYCIGIDIGITYAIALIMDLHANIIHKKRLTIKASENLKKVLNDIREMVEDVISASGIDRTIILGMGISFLGLINMETGIAIHAPNLPAWRNEPLVMFFQKALGFNTFLINNAKAMTLGEARFGVGKGKKFLFGVIIAEGIGSGIIIDGKLYTGFHGSAGEFGHMTEGLSGAVCSCGNLGCLQAIASESAVETNALRIIKSGCNSILNEYMDKNNSTLPITTIVNAANQGDEAAVQIIQQAVTYLGIGLANTVNLLSPEMIIIGGSSLPLYVPFIDILKKVIKEKAYTAEIGLPEIKVSSLGENASCIGAATVVMHHAFSTN